MEPVTIHHPVTSLSEVLILLGWTGVLTLIWYGVMGTRRLLTREAVICVLGRRPSEADLQAAQVSAGQMARLRKFHFSWPSFLLHCLPMVSLVVGSVTCSLLRDADHLVFWMVMVNGAAAGVAFGLVPITRRRLIRRVMLGEMA